ncbi:MAG TPA: PRC-barrel domain-containing protein [Steroidobacteraceae bacterium]
MSLERDNIVGDRTHAHGPGPEVMGASTLSGDSVVDRHGESLGEIKEIMVDVPTGRVAYAVLSAGGFLGIADKLFAVPWSALTLDTNNKQFILDVDKDRLKEAPGFDKDHWPSMAQPTWASTIYKFYGVEPYWK